jgi:WD40 repeat protein
MTLINSFWAHSFSSPIRRIRQSPFMFNGTFCVATCSDDATVKIWETSLNPSNWTLIRTYSNHSSEVKSVEWLNAITIASAGNTDGKIQIWSILSKDQTPTRTIQTPGVMAISSLTLLSNTIHMAVGGSNSIRIYDINNGTLVANLQGHTSWTTDIIQLSSDLLASGGWDYTVRIWNLTTNECKFNLTGHTFGVNRLKQITSQIVASGSYDSTIKLWDFTTGQLIRTLINHTTYIESIDLLFDYGSGQTLIVSGSADLTIKTWDWETGECLNTTKTDIPVMCSLAVVNRNKSLFLCVN